MKTISPLQLIAKLSSGMRKYVVVAFAFKVIYELELMSKSNFLAAVVQMHCEA